MAIRSVSFDDDSDEPLDSFSGLDLLLAHMDEVDLDWEEVAERSFLDSRRGLVITQVAVLEELIDEFILYVADPADPEEFQRGLDRRTIGPRLDELEQALGRRGLLDADGASLLADLRALASKRNELAHGVIFRTMVHVVPIKETATRDIELEWRIYSRRTRISRRITMSELRDDLHEAVGCFMALLKWGEGLVRRAEPPRNVQDFTYLAVQQPKGNRAVPAYEPPA
jgi:hypothetical protein